MSVSDGNSPSSVTVVKSVEFPTAFSKSTNDGKPEDEVQRMEGGLLKDPRYAWLSCGAGLQVVETATGAKVAEWTFGTPLGTVAPVVTCVAQLAGGADSHFVVALAHEYQDVVCVFAPSPGGRAQVVTAVQVPGKVTALTVVSSEVMDDDASPLASILCAMSGAVGVGLLGGRVLLFDLRGGVMSTEHAPGRVAAVTVHDNIEQRRREAERTGDHIGLVLNSGSFCDTQYLLQSPDGRVICKSRQDSVQVTALQYVPQIASLVVGFGFGVFQIWNLTNLSLQYTSPLLEDPMPVISLSFQEPSDDPRHYCYLWSVHGNADGARLPLAAMYSLVFQRRHRVDGYGELYQGFESCSLCFEQELGRSDRKDGVNFVCCEPIVRAPSQRLGTQYGADQESSRADSSLCLFAWSTLSCDRVCVRLFDLNQWYRAMMPSYVPAPPSPWPHSYMATYTVPTSRERALAFRVVPESFVPFEAALRQEEHFYPAAATFKSVCLSLSHAVSCRHESLQTQVLDLLSSGGPIAIATPSQLYRRCLSVGLRPVFTEADISAGAQAQREYLLTVALENHLDRLLSRCATTWANGCQGVLGGSLELWLGWAWQRAHTCKTNVDLLCVPLFDYSGDKLDAHSYSLLNAAGSQLESLASLFCSVLDYCRTNLVPAMPSDLEQQAQSLQLVSQYVKVVKWFLMTGLLPEHPESSVRAPADAIAYPVDCLVSNYQARRTELHDIAHRPGKEVPKPDPCSDVLYVDGLVSRGGRLSALWRRHGGGGLYPPPSLQALLRVYLDDGVPAHMKHALVLYVLLDLKALMKHQRHVVDCLHLFPHMIGMTASHSKLTQALWLLDHRDFADSVDALLDPSIRAADIEPWQHSLIVRALHSQGYHHLARDYIGLRKPPMMDVEDVRLVISLLVSSCQVTEALHYQRTNHDEANAKDLLKHFFECCMSNNQMGHAMQLPLTVEEEDTLATYLDLCQDGRGHDLQVFYFLGRSRYVEAMSCQDRIRRGGPTGNARQGGLREAMVAAYAGTLPTVTRQLARHCAGQRAGAGNWRQVARPAPMSVNVRRTATSATLMTASVAKARETWLEMAPHAAPPTAPPCTPVRSGAGVHNMPFLCTPGAHASPFGGGVPVVHPTPLAASAAAASTAKRKRNSSCDASLLLQTPHVKRRSYVADMQPTLQRLLTPHSILKVRHKSVSRSARGSATTAASEEWAEEDEYEPPAGAGLTLSRQIRFSLPPDSSNESEASESTHVLSDRSAEPADGFPTSSKSSSLSADSEGSGAERANVAEESTIQIGSVVGNYDAEVMQVDEDSESESSLSGEKMPLSGRGTATSQTEVVFSEQARSTPQTRAVFSEQRRSTPETKVVFSEQGRSTPQTQVVFSEQGRSTPQTQVVFSEQERSTPQTQAVFSEQERSMPQTKIQFWEQGRSTPQTKIQFSDQGKSTPQTKVVFPDQGRSTPQSKVQFSHQELPTPQEKFQYGKYTPQTIVQFSEQRKSTPQKQAQHSEQRTSTPENPVQLSEKDDEPSPDESKIQFSEQVRDLVTLGSASPAAVTPTTSASNESSASSRKRGRSDTEEGGISPEGKKWLRGILLDNSAYIPSSGASDVDHVSPSTEPESASSSLDDLEQLSGPELSEDPLGHLASSQGSMDREDFDASNASVAGSSDVQEISENEVEVDVEVDNDQLRAILESIRNREDSSSARRQQDKATEIREIETEEFIELDFVGGVEEDVDEKKLVSDERAEEEEDEDETDEELGEEDLDEENVAEEEEEVEEEEEEEEEESDMEEASLPAARMSVSRPKPAVAKDDDSGSDVICLGSDSEAEKDASESENDAEPDIESEPDFQLEEESDVDSEEDDDAVESGDDLIKPVVEAGDQPVAEGNTFDNPPNIDSRRRRFILEEDSDDVDSEDENAVKSEDEQIVELVGKPNVEADDLSVVESRGKRDSQSEVEQIDEEESRPVAESESKPAVESEGKPVVEPGSKPVVEQGSKPVVESEVKPIKESEVEPVVESSVEPVEESEVEQVVEYEIEPVVESAVEPVVESAVEPVVESLVEPIVESEVEPVVESEVEPVVESEVEPVVEMEDEPIVELAYESGDGMEVEPELREGVTEIEELTVGVGVISEDDPADEPVVELADDKGSAIADASESQYEPQLVEVASVPKSASESEGIVESLDDSVVVLEDEEATESHDDSVLGLDEPAVESLDESVVVIEDEPFVTSREKVLSGGRNESAGESENELIMEVEVERESDIPRECADEPMVDSEDKAVVVARTNEPDVSTEDISDTVEVAAVDKVLASSREETSGDSDILNRAVCGEELSESETSRPEGLSVDLSVTANSNILNQLIRRDVVSESTDSVSLDELKSGSVPAVEDGISVPDNIVEEILPETVSKSDKIESETSKAGNGLVTLSVAQQESAADCSEVSGVALPAAPAERHSGVTRSATKSLPRSSLSTIMEVEAPEPDRPRQDKVVAGVEKPPVQFRRTTRYSAHFSGLADLSEEAEVIVPRSFVLPRRSRSRSVQSDGSPSRSVRSGSVESVTSTPRSVTPSRAGTSRPRSNTSSSGNTPRSRRLMLRAASVDSAPLPNEAPQLGEASAVRGFKQSSDVTPKVRRSARAASVAGDLPQATYKVASPRRARSLRGRSESESELSGQKGMRLMRALSVTLDRLPILPSVESKLVGSEMESEKARLKSADKPATMGAVLATGEKKEASEELEEFASSRRLTRHQRAILQRSSDTSFKRHGSSQEITSEDASPLDSDQETTSRSSSKAAGPSSKQKKIVGVKTRSAHMKDDDDDTVSTASSGSTGHRSEPALGRRGAFQRACHALETLTPTSTLTLTPTTSASRDPQASPADRQHESEDEATSDAISVKSFKSADGARGRDRRTSLKTGSLDGDVRRSPRIKLLEAKHEHRDADPGVKSVGGLSTISEESLGSLQAMDREFAAAQARRNIRRTRGDCFISPITEEEKLFSDQRRRRTHVPKPKGDMAQSSRRSYTALRSRKVFDLLQKIDKK